MKKSVISILLCILMISLFFLGRWVGSMENAAISEKIPAEENATPLGEISAEEDSAEQNLNLSFVHNYDSHGYIPLEQGNYDGVGYSAIEDISIELGGESIPLEEALTEGHITVDEIIAQARLDAARGFCTEVAKSKNGLAELFYHYGNFSLQYIYDVFESPDAGQHLITSFRIYSNGANERGILFSFDEETGKWLALENWGLTFEVLKVDGSDITVKCTQTGGQQIGSFTVEDVWAIKITDPNAQDFEGLDRLTEVPASIAGTPLTMEGETELVVDFTELYGQLDAGEYLLSLDIQDQYNEEDVHPLMRNYHDRQVYQFPFTVE